MEGDVLGDPSSLNRRRRLKPENFVDRIWDEGEVCGQLRSLVGIVGEDAGHPSEVARHGLGAGRKQEEPEAHQLGVGQAAGIPGLVGDLRLQQFGEHVVTRVDLPVGELAPEVLEKFHDGVLGHLSRHSDTRLVDGEDVVHQVAKLLPVLLGHSEESGDDGRGQDGREVLHVVECPGADVRIEQICTHGPDPVLEHRHPTTGEGSGDQSPQHGVPGWIQGNDQPCIGHRFAGHRFEGRAMTRTECLHIPVGLLDVVKAGQHPEIKSIVVVERCLVPQALPERVRVVSEFRAERVPVQIGHLVPPALVYRAYVAAGPAGPNDLDVWSSATQWNASRIESVPLGQGSVRGGYPQLTPFERR